MDARRLGVVAAPAAVLLALIAPRHDTGNADTCTTVLQPMRPPVRTAHTGKLRP